MTKNILKRRLFNRASLTFKKKKIKKAAPYGKLLGCSYADYKTYIESLFVEGMSWKNTEKWNIDHIRPITTFDLHDHSQQFQCFNYQNTQPLWKHIDMQKGDTHYVH